MNESLSTEDRVGVLVSSCDAYSDVWDPFFSLFFKYWPRCPFPIFLVSNELIHGDPRVTTLATGRNKSWSQSFLAALEVISTDYVIVLMEDYLFREAPDTSRIDYLVDFMDREQVDCLRLFPTPPPRGPISGRDDLGELEVGAPHRVSLQAAIWRRSSLRSLVSENESPWEFESEGSKRADQSSLLLLSVMDHEHAPVSYFCTGVVKGKWVREAVEFLNHEGLSVDISARGVEPRLDELVRKLRYRVEDLLWHVFLKWRKKRSSVT